MDKIIELYKKGVDLTLNEVNLKKEPIERLRNAQALLAFACKIRALGKESRASRAKHQQCIRV